MSNRLLIIGGGLFGSIAAAYARSFGMEVLVFDCRKEGAASPAAACLFKKEWAGKKLLHHFDIALPILDTLFGIQGLSLTHDDQSSEEFLFVPPSLILESNPIQKEVTNVGDGWLEADGQRYEGFVYIAAGIWCQQFHSELNITGKAGAAFAFPGERTGRIQAISYGRQAIAFERDAGKTYFSDGTAEVDFTEQHEQQTLQRAKAIGLNTPPIERYFGYRPYTPGGPVFLRLGQRTWLATGGRKMGTILGASLAKRFVDEVIAAQSH